MTIQRILAVLFMVAGWLAVLVCNGSLNKPLNLQGAFAAVMFMLLSIAISVIR